MNDNNLRDLFDIEKTPGRIVFIPKAKKTLDEYEEALLSKQAIFEIWNHIVEPSAESITIRQELNSDSLGQFRRNSSIIF